MNKRVPKGVTLSCKRKSQRHIVQPFLNDDGISEGSTGETAGQKCFVAKSSDNNAPMLYENEKKF